MLTIRSRSVTIRLILVCHGLTVAASRASFPADESLTERGRHAAGNGWESAATAWCSPAAAARETAAALGLDPSIEPALRDCDYGRWRGLGLAEVQAAEPEAIQDWLTDPAARPHGGESVVDLIERTGDWLASLWRNSSHGRAVAVTHAAVIRAALVNVLAAPPASFWRVDVPPLARVQLTAHHGRWQVRATEPDRPPA
ncbi:histidine phosphatase family protein [Streptosporangium amethystogenes]|uniref:histidine phosphatase family protein n=1 Tax=Streptosporangium amethystogenes TaxID=2002 RepID=UPI0037AAEB6D